VNTTTPFDENREKLLYILSSLEDIGKTLTKTSNFKTSTRYLLRTLLGTVGISKGAIFSYQSGRGTLKLQAASGMKGKFPFVKIARESVKYLATHPHPCFVTDFEEVLDKGLTGFKDYFVSRNIHVFLPLTVKNELLGVVTLGPRFMNQEYTAADLETLGLLARHISLFFRSQKLFHETKVANYNLNRKILEMEQIYDIGLSITRLNSSLELGDNILMRATSILDASYGGLWLTEKNHYAISSVFGFELDGPVPEMMIDFSEVSPGSNINCEENPHCLSVPVKTESADIGMLAVAGKEDRRAGYSEFTEDDFQLLTAFANQAAIALENARLHESAVEKERMDQELKVAAEIQETLLPQNPPVLETLQIATRTRPCRTIGGDFYDFLHYPDNRLCLIVADVSGKSVPAAMLVSTFHGAVHAMQKRFLEPEILASELNSLITDATPDNKFITSAFVQWDPRTESITTVSAGHDPMLLIRSDGSSELLNAGGLILGLFPYANYEKETHRLAPGDILVIYTDGITDLLNRASEQYGFDRFKELCLQCIHQSADEILESVFQTLEIFREGVSAPDDQTLMVIKRV